MAADALSPGRGSGGAFQPGARGAAMFSPVGRRSFSQPRTARRRRRHRRPPTAARAPQVPIPDRPPGRSGGPTSGVDPAAPQIGQISAAAGRLRPAAIPAENGPTPRPRRNPPGSCRPPVELLQAAEVRDARSPFAMAAAICRTYCRFRPCCPRGSSKYLARPSSSHSGSSGTTRADRRGSSRAAGRRPCRSPLGHRRPASRSLSTKNARRSGKSGCRAWMNLRNLSASRNR